MCTHAEFNYSRDQENSLHPKGLLMKRIALFPEPKLPMEQEDVAVMFYTLFGGDRLESQTRHGLS
jgi:hypothetical protein